MSMVKEREPSVAELREEIDELKGKVTFLEGELSDAEEAAASRQVKIDADVEDAINRFLDEVERPVGKLSFVVPTTPAVDRTVLGLFDAIGRRP